MALQLANKSQNTLSSSLLRIITCNLRDVTIFVENYLWFSTDFGGNLWNSDLDFNSVVVWMQISCGSMWNAGQCITMKLLRKACKVCFLRINLKFASNLQGQQSGVAPDWLVTCHLQLCTFKCLELTTTYDQKWLNLNQILQDSLAQLPLRHNGMPKISFLHVL